MGFQNEMVCLSSLPPTGGTGSTPLFSDLAVLTSRSWFPFQTSAPVATFSPPFPSQSNDGPRLSSSQKSSRIWQRKPKECPVQTLRFSSTRPPLNPYESSSGQNWT